jgi:hypothetical protein
VGMSAASPSRIEAAHIARLRARITRCATWFCCLTCQVNLQ